MSTKRLLNQDGDDGNNDDVDEQRYPDIRMLLSNGILGAGYEAGITMTAPGIRQIALDKCTASRAIALRVLNASRHALIPLWSRAENGVLDLGEKQLSVAPGVGEFLLARKKRCSMRGSSGSLAWLIGDSGLVFVIAWSVPYWRCFYDNKIVVGVANANAVKPESFSFLKLYGSPEPHDGFDRKAFTSKGRGSSLRLTVRGFHIAAFMDTESKCLSQVTLVPLRERELSTTSRKYYRGEF